MCAPLPVCLITRPHSDACVIVLARACFPRKLKHELNLFFRADNLYPLQEIMQLRLETKSVCAALRL